MKTIIFLLLAASLALAAKPMESIENYNVILVHGAADMRSGLDCKSGAVLESAYTTIIADSIPNYTKRIGGYKDWALPWDDNFHGGFLFQRPKKSGATGMVKG